MKTLFFKAAVITVILFCSYLSALANKVLKFELSNEKVDSAWISEGPAGHFVVEVKLNEEYREYFSELTGSNVGRELVIEFSGKVLVNALVMGRIDSGIVQINEWDSEADAREFIRALLPKHRKNNIKSGSCLKQTEAIRPRAKEYLDMALDNLNTYGLTKDRHHLVKGLKLIDNALEADKRYLLGYYWKAVFLAKLEEYQKAVLALDEGIEEGSKTGDDRAVSLYFMRGALKQKTGMKDNALEDYEKARRIYERRLEIDPRNWDAIMNISLALVLMDKRRDAIKLLEETIEKYPQEEHLKQLLRNIKEFNVINYLENL